MSLQNLFYLLASIVMILNILFLIGVVVVGFMLKKKAAEIQATVEQKIAEAKNYVSRPEHIAATIGAAVADTVLGQIGKIFKFKSKKV